MRRNNQRLPAALFDDDEEEDSGDELQRAMREARIRKMHDGEDGMGMSDFPMTDAAIDFEDVKGRLALWIRRPEVERWIRRSFQTFLRTFVDENGMNVHEQRINEMCASNKQSLEVTYTHLTNKFPTLAIWIAEDPIDMIPILNVVAYDITMELYPEYGNIHKQIFVRIGNLPVQDSIRELRQINMNSLIKIRGVVVKRTNVLPELQKMFFRCVCGDIKGPIFHENASEGKQYLGQCVLC